ncbi:hypothetical protein PoB_006420400 [Plakobranchus ocellatus]|uniref:Uncharacterized protein n=1 Tax=Plakobranchus ocellatus TaxID=259542 RepID=A0AAV4D0U6_9GAST|nr:hypothetical protein PoB_006420400 [Plakobranchus ocellatus]
MQELENLPCNLQEPSLAGSNLPLVSTPMRVIKNSEITKLPGSVGGTVDSEFNLRSTGTLLSGGLSSGLMGGL